MYRKTFCNILTITIVLALIVSCVAAKDVNSNAGTSAFPFLKTHISARAVAMGGAFSGLADDESSLYYNPAGITAFEEKRYIAGYQNNFSEMQNGFLGYIKPFGNNKAFGIYLSYLNYGNFIETDIDGNQLGEFSGGDIVLAGSLAVKKSHKLSYGGSFKLIYESVHDYSAFGLAVDLGLKYTNDRNRAGVGLAVQNLGFQLSSLGEEKEKLPLNFRGGMFYRPRGIEILLSSDLILPIDNDPFIALGGEYYNFQPLYLRLGWNSFGKNYRSSFSDDNLSGLSFGVGFDYKRMQLSYAYSPGAELGDSHRITLTGGI